MLRRLIWVVIFIALLSCLQSAWAGVGEVPVEIIIQIGDHMLAATLVENTTSEALIALLREGPVTIEMHDYAGMEKVGALPQDLPRNDERISTEAGDLIVYQGNQFVIYYGTNDWSLTKVGKINEISQGDLKEILGEGDVTVVLSLPEAK